MLVSELFEYLDSGFEVPTEINGFLLSIDASLNQKRKIEKSNFMLILCSGYAIMILCCYDNLTKSLCYYAVMIT